jgi:rhodanese-related sulfurtransferase
MTHAIRSALVILPLGLVLSGCAGPRGSESSFGQASRPSARDRGLAMVVNRSSLESKETLGAPRGEPSAADSQHYITLEQFREYVQNGAAVVIDARGPEQFANGHVRGAHSIPAGQIEAKLAAALADVATGQLIIVYCSSSSCGSSDMVSEYLMDHGYTDVRVFRPGWAVLASAQGLH